MNAPEPRYHAPLLKPEAQEFINDAARLLRAGYDPELILRSLYAYAYFNGALDYAKADGTRHSAS